MKLFSKEESYISKKVQLYGNVESESDILIDGSVYGNVRSKKHVMLGATARFEGNIESDTVMVCGYFKGTIVAKRMIEVRTPATVVGDLISDSVRVESGVAIQGKVMAKTVEQEYLPHAESVAEEPIPVTAEE